MAKTDQILNLSQSSEDHKMDIFHMTTKTHCVYWEMGVSKFSSNI